MQYKKYIKYQKSLVNFILKGPIRIRNELIPFLIEIIEECDNDEEFIINLAE